MRENALNKFSHLNTKVFASLINIFVSDDEDVNSQGKKIFGENLQRETIAAKCSESGSTLLDRGYSDGARIVI